MKINIPKVIVPVDLGGYASELNGEYLQVWVNMPMEKLRIYNELVTALQSDELEKAKKIILPANTDTATAEETPLSRTFKQLTRLLKHKREQKGDGVEPRLLEWYAEVWSQGTPDMHWSVSELQTLESQDPAFLSWMIAQTWAVRSAHIDGKKKV